MPEARNTNSQVNVVSFTLFSLRSFATFSHNIVVSSGAGATAKRPNPKSISLSFIKVATFSYSLLQMT